MKYNIVQLKSGGPLMIAFPTPLLYMFRCQYFDNDGFQEIFFDQVMLRVCYEGLTLSQANSYIRNKAFL